MAATELRRVSLVALSTSTDADGDLRELRVGESRSWKCASGRLSKESIAQHATYFRLHFSTLFLVSLLAGVVVYAAESSGAGIRFIDAWFATLMAFTEAGLLTVDAARLTPLSQAVIFVGMLLGSPILLSVVPPALRLWYTRHAPLDAEAPVDEEADTDGSVTARAREQRLASGNVPLAVQRSALWWLVALVVGYCVVLQLLGALVWASVLEATGDGQAVLAADGVDASAAWVGVFHAVSSFNNAGIALYGDSLASFASVPAVLVTAGLLIVAGNIGFPLLLYFCVAAAHALTQRRHAGLAYLLHHGRACYTHLFDRGQTFVLARTQLASLGIACAMILILDFGQPYLEAWPPGMRAGLIIFQVVSTRTAGFAVVDIASMSTAIQVAFAFFMYLTAYPFVVAMRQSSRSALGGARRSSVEGENYHDTFDDADTAALRAPPRRRLAVRTRAIASSIAQDDLPWLLLAVIAILIAEGTALRTTPNPRYLSFLGIVFEVMSAYGTVGLSFGYPGTVMALSAQFGVFSRLVIMAVALAGRHRGIPAAVDASVFLPDLLQAQRHKPPSFSVARAVEGGVVWARDELDARVAPIVERAQGALAASVVAVERSLGLEHPRTAAPAAAEAAAAPAQAAAAPAPAAVFGTDRDAAAASSVSVVAVVPTTVAAVASFNA